MPFSRCCMGWLFSKRRKLFFFLFLAGLSLAYPAGAETLIGTVVSVEKNRFVIQEKQPEEAGLTPREFQVLFVPATQRGRFSSGPSFPRCVRKGRMVRLSGSFDTERKVFLALKIHGVPGRGKHRDPTGVRARLGRCRHPRGMP